VLLRSFVWINLSSSLATLFTRAEGKKGKIKTNSDEATTSRSFASGVNCADWIGKTQHDLTQIGIQYVRQQIVAMLGPADAKWRR